MKWNSSSHFFVEQCKHILSCGSFLSPFLIYLPVSICSLWALRARSVTSLRGGRNFFTRWRIQNHDQSNKYKKYDPPSHARFETMTPPSCFFLHQIYASVTNNVFSVEHFKTWAKVYIPLSFQWIDSYNINLIQYTKTHEAYKVNASFIMKIEDYVVVFPQTPILG